MKNAPSAKIFAQRLRDTLESLNISQVEFAQRAEVSSRTVQIWVSSDASIPRQGTLRRISELLRVPPKWLIGEVDQISSPPSEPPGSRRRSKRYYLIAAERYERDAELLENDAREKVSLLRTFAQTMREHAQTSPDSIPGSENEAPPELRFAELWEIDPKAERGIKSAKGN